MIDMDKIKADRLAEIAAYQAEFDARPFYLRDHGHNVNNPINSIIYDLCNGGDDVRGKPETWGQLRENVWIATLQYKEYVRLTRTACDRMVNKWLEVNERKYSK